MNRAVLFLAFAALLFAISVQAQGPIDPVAAPQPTMKTLDQLEPRMPIESLPYVIEKGGSYYLARNVALGSTNEHGITVAANDVVLDLSGFVLDGPTDGYGEPLPVSGSAIYQVDGYRNLTVKNGSVVHWTDQDTEGAGMVRMLGRNNRIQNVSLRFCSRGIEMGPGSIVEDCSVTELAEINESFGFKVGDGSVVRDCVATLIYGDPVYGFNSGANCVFERCTAISNYNDSTHAYGFSVGNNSVVEHCTAVGTADGKTEMGFQLGDASRASFCTASHMSDHGFSLSEWVAVVDCAASACTMAGFWVTEGGCLIERCTAQNNGVGISAGYNGIVRDCISTDNTGHGIDVRESANTIQGNVCTDNTSSSGIYVFEDANRIEENHLYNNAYGLFFRYWTPDSLAQRNIAMKNTAYGNALANYDVGTSNSVAPIEPAGTFSNPWANFEL